MTSTVKKGSLGAVTRELIREAIVATCEQMSLAVIRTSHSETVKSAMDFSTAICDATGEMVGQGVTLPNQLGAIPDAMASIFRTFGDDMQPGDVFMLNDPFAGGTHLPDVYVIAPVFYQARLVALIATVAHHADLGGMAPGSMSPHAEECYQEGLRIPPVKFYVRGKPNQAVHALIRANCRIPDVVLGDFAAQVVACRTGEAGFLKLVEAYGLEPLLDHLRDLLDYTEALTRAEIRSLPDGVYRYTDYMDDDGVHLEHIPIQVKLTIAGDEIEADFEGTSPQLPVPLNSTLSFTKSCVYYSLRTIMQTDIPHNAGFFRAITVTAPQGSILNCILPAARSGSPDGTRAAIPSPCSSCFPVPGAVAPIATASKGCRTSAPTSATFLSRCSSRLTRCVSSNTGSSRIRVARVSSAADCRRSVITACSRTRS